MKNMTITRRIGWAMIPTTSEGTPKKVLQSLDINELGGQV
jgi:hypothetical protein